MCLDMWMPQDLIIFIISDVFVRVSAHVCLSASFL
jgi:hypothetical protein